ncbi:MAG TPA: ester cyclase [Puia sp.]|jgi:predicted ester cyclase
MSTIQKNKETISAIYNDGFNKRNLQLLQDLISPEYVGADGKKGSASFEAPLIALIKGLPDVQWEIQELFGEGDKLAVRWKIYGTHTSVFTGFPPTGNRVSSDGMAIFEFEAGKIIRITMQTDRLGFLQQINVLPADLSQLPRPATV